ncbi:MAG TPA: Pyrrolo-quinoline quinone [Verrucomicrobia bacterium]|nr:Pyrrolo-quinoline quinone [Verrucomicrobiota bacterium]
MWIMRMLLFLFHRGCHLTVGVFLSMTILTLVNADNAVTSSSNWPAWRGASANGATASGEYPVKWTVDEVDWKVALPGKGGSTPIVWQDVIYLTTPSDEEDAVMAIDFEGKVLWQTRLGIASAPRHRSLGSSCNSSPVTDGQSIFVYYRSGRFASLDFNGTVQWSVDLTEPFGPEKLFWDQGSSPVVTDDYVILTRMHEGESWIAGFDKKSGVLKWRELRNFQTPRENNNGYSTPLLFKQSGKNAVMVWGADHLTAHDANGGNVLWTCGGFNPDGTEYWPAIATPIIYKDIAVIPVGRDDRSGQARIHGIRLGGEGDITDSHRAWKREDLGVFVPTLAESKGRVYLLRNRGGVACLNPTTGATIWSAQLPKHRAPYYSSPVIANGLLYAAREDGVVFVARVGEKFELLSENPMNERIVASPVPVRDCLLLRGDKHLFCIKK